MSKLRHHTCAALVTAAAFILAVNGCSHRLEIKNLSQYRATNVAPLDKRVSIGILTSVEDMNTKLLVRQVGIELQKYSGEVVFPYLPSNAKAVDVIADIRVTPEYKGSGANFLVNFPGFLVFAPAWHGYNYKVIYNIDVILTEAAKNKNLDSFSIPIALNVRHAEMDRTWTELSWLEVGVIAFIGGFYCIGYDHDVTPLVAEHAKGTVGENVAGEIIARINASGRFASLIR